MIINGQTITGTGSNQAYLATLGADGIVRGSSR